MRRTRRSRKRAGRPSVSPRLGSALRGRPPVGIRSTASGSRPGTRRARTPRTRPSASGAWRRCGTGWPWWCPQRRRLDGRVRSPWRTRPLKPSPQCWRSLPWTPTCWTKTPWPRGPWANAASPSCRTTRPSGQVCRNPHAMGRFGRQAAGLLQPQSPAGRGTGIRPRQVRGATAGGAVRRDALRGRTRRPAQVRAASVLEHHVGRAGRARCPRHRPLVRRRRQSDRLSGGAVE